MHDDLRDRVRAAAGRASAPTAAVIDPQSVTGAGDDQAGCARRGYGAGKKISGTGRHLAVDVPGLLLPVLVTAAPVQDRGPSGAASGWPPAAAPMPAGP